MYRFWSESFVSHFYTASEQERDQVINTQEDDIWRFEGIAWYSPMGPREPGDTFETAQVLEPVALIHESFEQPGDVDIFELELEEGTFSAASSGDTDTHGRLMDAAGTLLAENADRDLDDTNFALQLDVQAGTYYLEVMHESETGVGPYELRIGDVRPVCVSNADCAAGMYCGKAAGFCDGEGVCQSPPQNCTAEYDPVCGCDGAIYGNACNASASGVSLDDPQACGLAE